MLLHPFSLGFLFILHPLLQKGSLAAHPQLLSFKVDRNLPLLTLPTRGFFRGAKNRTYFSFVLLHFFKKTKNIFTALCLHNSVCLSTPIYLCMCLYRFIKMCIAYILVYIYKKHPLYNFSFPTTYQIIPGTIIYVYGNISNS